VFRGFFKPPGGVVPVPRDTDHSFGGHAITVVGWDPADGFGVAEGAYFKVKNSWGTEWGDGGYGYLPQAYVEQWSGDNWGSIDLLTTKPRAA
jgi:C1A family cysteine protease